MYCRLSGVNSLTSSQHGGHHVTAGPGSPSAATVTLLAVSFYLIAMTLPVTVCYVLYLGFPVGDSSLSGRDQTVDPTWMRHHVYLAVRTTIEELAMSKYACNFYIYLVTGTAFRHELRRLVGRCFSSLDVIAIGGTTSPNSFTVNSGHRYTDLQARRTVAGYTDCHPSKASAL